MLRIDPAELLHLPQELMSQRLEALMALVVRGLKPIDPAADPDAYDGAKQQTATGDGGKHAQLQAHQSNVYSGTALVLWLLQRRVADTVSIDRWVLSQFVCCSWSIAGANRS